MKNNKTSSNITSFNKMFKGKFVHLVTKRDYTDYVEAKDGSFLDVVNPFAIKGFFIKRDKEFYYLGEKNVHEVTDIVSVSDFSMMQIVGQPVKPKNKYEQMLDDLPVPGKKDVMN